MCFKFLSVLMFEHRWFRRESDVKGAVCRIYQYQKLNIYYLQTFGYWCVITLKYKVMCFL